MKQIKERTEIAKAINFGKYPVLTIDLNKPIYLGGKICGFGGCKVKVPYTYNGENLYCGCEIEWFEDTKQICFSQGPLFITNEYSGYDLYKDVEYAQAVTLQSNDEFILVIINSEETRRKAECYPFLLKTEKRFDRFSSEPISIVKEDRCIDLMKIYHQVKIIK